MQIEHDKERIAWHSDKDVEIGIAERFPSRICITSGDAAANVRTMDEIADACKVFQWRADMDPEWNQREIHFWCPSNQDGSRDLRFVDLTLDDEFRTAGELSELSEKVLDIIKRNAADDCRVVVEWSTRIVQSACREMAIRRRAEIGTRKVEYRGMTGRFNRWGFHKDRDAKNKYYPLEDYAVCCAKVVETMATRAGREI